MRQMPNPGNRPFSAPRAWHAQSEIANQIQVGIDGMSRATFSNLWVHNISGIAARSGLVCYIAGPIAIVIGLGVILTNDPFESGFPVLGTILIAFGIAATYLSIPLMIFGARQESDPSTSKGWR